jgi:NADH:ubiquinone oxidoreductase subunit D
MRRSAVRASPPTWAASAVSNATSASWHGSASRAIIKELPTALNEFDKLLVRNRDLHGPLHQLWPLSAANAPWPMASPVPNLRAAGVDYDVRVADPYSSYEDFDFKIPVGKSGDVYDRFTVRQEEMRQSLSIIAKRWKSWTKCRTRPLPRRSAGLGAAAEARGLQRHGGADLAFQDRDGGNGGAHRRSVPLRGRRQRRTRFLHRQ